MKVTNTSRSFPQQFQTLQHSSISLLSFFFAAVVAVVAVVVGGGQNDHFQASGSSLSPQIRRGNQQISIND